MAEEILVRASLTDQMIDAGARLLNDIKDTDLEVVAAFWLFFTEAGEWRLVLVSPRIDKDGPRKLYEQLSEKLYAGTDKVYGIDIFNITFMSPSERLVGALADANRQSTLSSQRLPGIYLNGVYVEDLYVYFISNSLKPTRGTDWYI